MSTSIYIPYFYIIQHIESGKYYSGVRYGKNANPDQLLKHGGYQTSSPVVKQIIFEEGLESFTIRKIKVFDTGEEALDYESRFLRRVNASFNDNFLNRSNNSMNALNTDWVKYKQNCLEKYGVEYPMQSDEVKEKHRKNCLENLGVEYPSQLDEVKEKKKQTCLEIFGVENPSQSDEIKEKKRQTCLENLGVEHPMQSELVREKSRQSCLDNLGVEYPSQSPEVRVKIKQVCLERYGCENVSQSEEIKEKKKQASLERYGVEHPMHSEEVKEKKKQSFSVLKKRPIVLEIMKYKEKFNLNFIHCWFWKKQEFLDNLLVELKITHGEIY